MAPENLARAAVNALDAGAQRGLGNHSGAGFHALLVLGLQVPLPVSLMKYYSIAVLATPGMMMFSIGMTVIAPRGVSVQPTAIVIQNRQSAAALMADRVVQWRFCSIKGQPRSALFALRYTTRRHRHRTLVLALSKKVDILDLDRRMRLMQRLSQYRALSNQRRHAR